MIAGSFALAMNGIVHPQLPPQDLDILMNDAAWERDFRNLKNVVRSPETGDLIRLYSFPDKDKGEIFIEASKRWIVAGLSRKEIFNSHRIHGMKVFSPVLCKRTMEYLDRPKDRMRLEML